MMKQLYLLLIPIAMGMARQVYAQDSAIDKFFHQYLEDTRFNVVYIGPKLFELMGNVNVDGVEMDDEEAKAFVDLAKTTKGLKILSTKTNPRDFFKEAKNKISTSGYEVLMTVRNNEEAEDVEFLVKEEDKVIRELFLLIGGEDEFVMMSFVGNLDLKKISNLAKSMDDEKH